MWYKNIILTLLIFLPAGTCSTRAADPDTCRLSILFAGDIMGHDTQIIAAYNQNQGLYEYDCCFRHVAPMVKKADIAIANLEVTLAGAPYRGYPRFSSPDALAGALKRTGFDVVLTANNHALDRRSQGLERTLRILDAKGILHAGTYRDTPERISKHPLMLEKNGILVALLNYTYGVNELKTDGQNIVNRIDTTLMARDISRARSAGADFLIAALHWGNEYERQPSRFQRSLAVFLLDKGVDAIIGSHPHVVQPIEKYPRKGYDPEMYQLVVFSLGNFISNQRERHTDGGIMVRLDLEKSGNTRIRSFGYTPVWVHRKNNPSGTEFTLLPAFACPEDPVQERLKTNDREKMNLFYRDVKAHLEGIPLLLFPCR